MDSMVTRSEEARGSLWSGMVYFQRQSSTARPIVLSVIIQQKVMLCETYEC